MSRRCEKRLLRTFDRCRLERGHIGACKPATALHKAVPDMPWAG